MCYCRGEVWPALVVGLIVPGLEVNRPAKQRLLQCDQMHGQQEAAEPGR